MEYINEDSFICNFKIANQQYVIYEDEFENINYGKIIINNYGIQEIVDLTEEEYVRVQKTYNNKFKDVLTLEVDVDE